MEMPQFPLVVKDYSIDSDSAQLMITKASLLKETEADGKLKLTFYVSGTILASFDKTSHVRFRYSVIDQVTGEIAASEYAFAVGGAGQEFKNVKCMLFHVPNGRPYYFEIADYY